MKVPIVSVLLRLMVLRFVHSATSECSEIVGGSDCQTPVSGNPGPNTAVVYRTEQEAVSMARCYTTCVQANERVS